MPSFSTPDAPPEHVRVAVIGAGFGGLGMAVALQQHGIDDYVVLERADDVGGTWRDNTYPGCRCDVPSHLYSFSFALNPDWSETYSPQPEIWDYLRRCAKDSGVVEHIRFGAELQDAAWDDAGQRWRIETSSGPLTADALVLGPGPLSEPATPAIPGLDRFEGHLFHSARWDHEHDLSGERVAVIGTGASAIQFVPEIQPLVHRLHVFQRTPGWVLPHPTRPIPRRVRALFRRFPAAQRLVRSAIYWGRELLVIGMAKNPRFLRPVERLARLHLRKQVPDARLRARLTPDFSPGCKRLLLSNDWYPALQAPNAELVTDGIREVRPHSIVTTDGVEREVDTIILATGFRVTNHPIADLVRGARGESLAATWAGSGMQAYLGTTISGFPNLFFLAGPNTGIGHTSLVVMIEAQIAYALDALRQMEQRAVASFDVRPDVQDAFNERLQVQLRSTVWNAGGCASWYLDEHGRNTTLWPDFTFRFVNATKRFDAESYEAVSRNHREAIPRSQPHEVA